MDKEKMGSFIVQLRKGKKLTQRDLAEQLHITDKAVSKWERGVSFPDISLLEPLASILDVSVLELLKGERLENNLSLSHEEATEIVNQSITISDDERIREHIKSKITIVFITLVLMLSVSIILNIFNYHKGSIAGNLSIDSDAYLTTEDENGHKVFVDSNKALQQLLLDLDKIETTNAEDNEYE